MAHILIPYDLKEYLFHRGRSFSIQSIQETGLIPGGKESKGGRQTIFFTPLNPLGDDYTIHRKVHHHSNWKRNHDAVNWVKLSRAQDRGLQFFWKTSSHTIIIHSCASRLHPQSNLSKQRSNTLQKTLNPTTRAESHTEK